MSLAFICGDFFQIDYDRLQIFYIRHYFILENGVQTLYVLYEQLLRKEGFPENRIPSTPGVVIKPLKK